MLIPHKSFKCSSVAVEEWAVSEVVEEEETFSSNKEEMMILVVSEEIHLEVASLNSVNLVDEESYIHTLLSQTTFC